MRIVLSGKRAGSTALYVKYLNHEDNKEAQIIKPSEFLNPWHKNPNVHGWPAEKRIEFLESEREKGNEYYLKIHVNHLEESNIKEWFYDFYKNDTIVFMKRRNLWEWFLSYNYQYQTNWKQFWMDEGETPKQIESNNFDINVILDRFWWQNIKIMNEYHGDEEVFYEDIDFGDVPSVKQSNVINYLDYVPNDFEDYFYGYIKNRQ